MKVRDQVTVSDLFPLAERGGELPEGVFDGLRLEGAKRATAAGKTVVIDTEADDASVVWLAESGTGPDRKLCEVSRDQATHARCTVRTWME